jgi:hypothetical protein
VRSSKIIAFCGTHTDAFLLTVGVELFAPQPIRAILAVRCRESRAAERLGLPLTRLDCERRKLISWDEGIDKSQLALQVTDYELPSVGETKYKKRGRAPMGALGKRRPDRAAKRL